MAMAQQQSEHRRQVSVIEIVVTVVVLLLLGCVLYAFLQQQREKAARATCLENVRMLAGAFDFYQSDNSGWCPGAHWKAQTEIYCDEGLWDKIPAAIPTKKSVERIPGHLYDNRHFHCPDDANGASGAVSYAYNSVFLRSDGTGIRANQILSPPDLGVICDASPSGTIGGLIGTGTIADSSLARTPSLRHHGIIIGFVDGHAKYYPLTGWDPKDSANPINTAFYLSEKFGFVEKKVKKTRP